MTDKVFSVGITRPAGNAAIGVGVSILQGPPGPPVHPRLLVLRRHAMAITTVSSTTIMISSSGVLTVTKG